MKKIRVSNLYKRRKIVQMKKDTFFALIRKTLNQTVKSCPVNRDGPKGLRYAPDSPSQGNGFTSFTVLYSKVTIKLFAFLNLKEYSVTVLSTVQIGRPL
jgi:hypothetical protein